MKKIMSLLLCLAMIFSVMVLSSCGSTDSDDSIESISDDSSDSATTLTMYVITGDETTPEAEALVSEAINKLTKSQYKTQVNFVFLTADEYYETMDALLQENEDEVAAAAEAKKNKKKGETTTETESETESETSSVETNKYGITVTRYPTVDENQVDILYIGNIGDVKGVDKYEEYIENGWLSALNSELSGSSKKLQSYVSSSLLSAAQYNGTTYAIPNNNMIGEYTYMLIDKELYDGLYYTADIDTVKTVTDLSDFLADVKEFYPDVVPIASTYDECKSNLAYYWDISIDTTTYASDPLVNGTTAHHSYSTSGNFSVIGYAYDDLSTISRGKTVLSFDSLFTNKTYVTNFLTLNKYKFEDYYGTPTEGQKAAVQFVTGDGSLEEYYEDQGYYVVKTGYPKVTEDDVYGNMFAVSAYTSSLSRSMEIITFLNTNAEVRNLLQYGIEGTNYKVQNGVAVRLNHDYMMDIESTGNCFIAYPDGDAGMSADIWTVAMAQNRVALLDPLYGFSFDKILKWEYPAADQEATETETGTAEGETSAETEAAAETEAEASAETESETEAETHLIKEVTDDMFGTFEMLDETLINAIHDLSVKTEEQINACTTYEELETLVTSLSKSLTAAKNANIKKITDSSFAEAAETETDENGEVVETKKEEETYEYDKDGNPIIVQTVESYTPFVVYYNWLTTYGYLPTTVAN